jgi:membrane peptidoglycan carboxypeptidase
MQWSLASLPQILTKQGGSDMLAVITPACLARMKIPHLVDLFHAERISKKNVIVSVELLDVPTIGPSPGNSYNAQLTYDLSTHFEKIPLHVNCESTKNFPPRLAPAEVKMIEKKSTRRLSRRHRLSWWPFVLIFTAACLAVGYYEIKTSTMQAKFISGYAANLRYRVADGASDKIIFPKKGPYDIRLGYVQLPAFLDKLLQNGMVISRQARFSEPLQNYAEKGFHIPYSEKSQAGLHILDATGESMYRMINPKRVYNDFFDIPYKIVQTLLFIENRTLLSDQFPKTNPAVDWGRFAKALVVQAGELVSLDMPAMGGSTLATQMEKFRHSDNGMTVSAKEKLIQMVSASVRAYQDGEDTSLFRRQLVLDYVNSVPLSAAPGFGEVNGLGDGLFVWYGTEFDEMNRLLNLKDPTGVDLEKQALLIKQVVSLMIAHRRPSFYLVEGRKELAILSNSYVRLLAQNGSISEALSEAAQAQPLFFRNFSNNGAARQIVNNKGVNVVRNRLGPLFDTSLYSLDRMDVTVTSTLNSRLQEQVNLYLKNLEKSDVADGYGLVGKYLLTPDQADELSYSFTLFERTPMGNMVRVQTDTTPLPFDINEGSKLELGSTAKLRTLATYLEIIAELHADLAARSQDELKNLMEQTRDTLSRWVGFQLLQNPSLQLKALLEAAMLRPYSAHPGERFFTGGGLHTFGNFRNEDNNRIATVTEALQYSLNLPFVRIMQDIVRYTQASQWENNRQIVIDDNDPRRKEMLDKFIDRESKVFLTRFWNKYRNMNADQRLETLLAGMNPRALRLTIVHRHLLPEADQDAYIRFIRGHLPTSTLTNRQLAAMYEKYQPGSYNLQDMGYLAAVHPLELWLLDYLRRPGDLTLQDAIMKSTEVRREVYGWLMRTKAKNARDSRVRIVLEIDAFSDIHRRWKNMGYPFGHLVPSLATALGSSGDRPAALAELMGIILNDGKRIPTHRFTEVAFARDTPYETIALRPTPKPVQVLRPEIAQVLKETLGKVVSEGTAKRLAQSFQQGDGLPLAIGGKTGTGDNRIINSSSSGQKSSSRALNRTATFVFYLGDNHFGTLIAFVSGRSANAFSFTSALPLQVLKGMVPVIQPYINTENQKISAIAGMTRSPDGG